MTTYTITTPKGDPDKTYSLPHYGTYLSLLVEHLRGRLEDNAWRETLVSAGRLLQVPCPKCKVGVHEWCVLPNERLYKVLHIDRWRKAYAEGWWDKTVIELPIPGNLKGKVPWNRGEQPLE